MPIFLAAILPAVIAAATQPSMPEMPKPEGPPAPDPLIAEREANRRRRRTRKYGRGSTLTSGSPLGIVDDPGSSAKVLTGGS
jgi:hypothetical protein